LGLKDLERSKSTIIAIVSDVISTTSDASIRQCGRFFTTLECLISIDTSKLGKIDTTPSQREILSLSVPEAVQVRLLSSEYQIDKKAFEIQLSAYLSAPK
jgi:hypothetical protein